MSERATDDPDSVQTLWNIGLETIAKSLTLWRTYKDDDRSKAKKISFGLKIARVVMEMLDRHPDVKAVREAREKMRELIERAEKDTSS